MKQPSFSADPIIAASIGRFRFARSGADQMTKESVAVAVAIRNMDDPR